MQELYKAIKNLEILNNNIMYASCMFAQYENTRYDLPNCHSSTEKHDYSPYKGTHGQGGIGHVYLSLIINTGITQIKHHLTGKIRLISKLYQCRLFGTKSP